MDYPLPLPFPFIAGPRVDKEGDKEGDEAGRKEERGPYEKQVSLCLLLSRLPEGFGTWSDISRCKPFVFSSLESAPS